MTAEIIIAYIVYLVNYMFPIEKRRKTGEIAAFPALSVPSAFKKFFTAPIFQRGAHKKATILSDDRFLIFDKLPRYLQVSTVSKKPAVATWR